MMLFGLKTTTEGFNLSVAQLEEHVIWDHEAGGSSPLTQTNLAKGGRHREQTEHQHSSAQEIQ